MGFSALALIRSNRSIARKLLMIPQPGHGVSNAAMSRHVWGSEKIDALISGVANTASNKKLLIAMLIWIWRSFLAVKISRNR